jgi:hypothetical protein
MKQTIQIEGILEIDQDRGVIYFHSNGHTPLRIGFLPKPIPDPLNFGMGLDIMYMKGCNWKNEDN